MISINGIDLNVTKFPDGTSQVWKLPEEAFSRKVARVIWDFEFEGELMHIAQLKHLLSKHSVLVHLNMTYLPYARQDKDVDNGTTFALHTFAHIINSLHFYRVSCLDPHSNIPKNLIANFDANYPIFTVVNLVENHKYDMVCYPDAGALDKYSKMYNFPYVFGEKVRNQSTGHIESYKLNGNVENKNVLIIDDICDGGGTFVLLAKELYKAGASNVSLFVTHGIFSKGLTPLKEVGIDRIFTAQGEWFEVQDYLTYKPYLGD